MRIFDSRRLRHLGELLDVPPGKPSILGLFAGGWVPVTPQTRGCYSQTYHPTFTIHFLPMKLAYFCIALISLLGTGQAQDTEETFEVTVQTLSGSYRDTTPVANQGFVVLPLKQGPYAKPITSGVTNEKGEAHISIPRSYFKGYLPRVIVRLDQPGMQDVYGRWERPSNGPWADSRVVQLFPKKGRTLYFQAFSPAGDPVRARLAWRNITTPSKWGPRNLYLDEQLGAGWFVVNVEDSCELDVWAWKSGVGAATLLGVNSDEGTPGEHKLILKGESGLRGQLKGLDGTGVVAMPMFIRKQGREWVPGNSGNLPGVVEPGHGVGAEGLEFGWCVTDESGNFELQGLAPGAYEALVGSGPHDSSFWSPLVGEIALTSDASSILNFTRPVVQVQLLNSEGKPWEGSQADQEIDDYPELWKRYCDFSSWPDSPQLIVRGLRNSKPTSLAFWLRSPVFWSEGRTFFSEISPGNYYAVQVIGGPFQGKVQVIHAPADGTSIKLDVVAGAPTPFGKLQVIPKRRGHEIGKAKWRRDFGLWVADVETGVPLLTWPMMAEGTGEFSLPEGKYRVVLEGRSQSDSHHGTLMRSRSAGRAEAIVHIKSATEKTIDLDMDRGGFLNITLKGEFILADLAAIRKRYKRASVDTPWLIEEANKARLRIYAPNFIPDSVKFAGQAMEGTTSAGRHLINLWPLGTTQKSEMLPAGTYELIATMPGGRERRKTIEIKAWSTEDLVLDFSDQ